MNDFEVETIDYKRFKALLVLHDNETDELDYDAINIVMDRYPENEAEDIRDILEIVNEVYYEMEKEESGRYRYVDMVGYVTNTGATVTFEVIEDETE